MIAAANLIFVIGLVAIVGNIIWLVSINSYSFRFGRSFFPDLYLITSFYFTCWWGSVVYYESLARINVLTIHAIMLVILAFAVSNVSSVLSTSKEIQNQITKQSIKEGIDTLPMGICFYNQDGQVILKNNRIDEIALQLSGEGLKNGIQFYDMISSDEQLVKGYKISEFMLPTILLDDGKVFTCLQEKLNISGTEIFELLLVDNTDLHQLSTRIENDNLNLTLLNQRLKNYNNIVTQLTRQEEILEAKMKIHDELGQTLLATKYYLNNPDMDVQSLMEMWQMNITLLRHQQQEKDDPDPTVYMKQAGSAIGVDIEIEGSLPSSEQTMRLFNSALREAMTNAVKHGKAKKLYIQIEKIVLGYKVTFKDDGVFQKGPVVEGTGIAGLKDQLEPIGGKVVIKNEQQFIMEVYIPEDGGVDYD